MATNLLGNPLISSATTAMAVIAIASPVHSHQTNAADASLPREEIKPVVRPAYVMDALLVERTDGTIEFRENLWLPSIPDSNTQVSFVGLGGGTFSDDVRAILDISRWSAREFGEVIGVDRVTVQNWLAGRSLSSDNQESLLQISDVLRRASAGAGQLDVQRWLITPSAVDGRTPKQLLAEGEYDEARMRAMMSPSRISRIERAVSTSQVSPWSRLLEG